MNRCYLTTALGILLAVCFTCTNLLFAEDSLFDELIKEERGLDIYFVDLDSITWEPESEDEFPKTKRSYARGDYHQLQMVPAHRAIKDGEFYAVLKTGSVVTRLSDKSDFTAKKKWVVRGYLSLEDHQTVFLLSKSGKRAYYTPAMNLISLESDRKLTPRPRKYISSYSVDGRDYTTEKNFKLDIQVLGYKEVVYLDYFNQTGERGQGVGAWRFETNLYPQYSFPLSFGLSFGAEQGGFSNYAWSTFDAGATLKVPFEIATYQLAFLASYQFSPFFMINSGSGQSYHLSANSWQYNLTANIYKALTIGFAYRTSYLSYQDEPRQSDLSTSSERKPIYSYALNLGYTFDVTLW
jgi:hypothetical protein